MGNPPKFTRITKEDFSKDDRELVGKLAFPINSFMEETRNLFNGNINFNNLNQEIIELSTQVDSSGVPLVNTQIKTSLNKVIGTNCIYSSIAPINTPFLTFIQNGQILNISNITGLSQNTQYTLRFIAYGD